jgi:4-amino-4-deoxy-L-arabinose transferase-like glycosyltransferase
VLQRRWVQIGLILIGIGIASGLCDRIWVATHEPILDWDQADYLTGAMNYWRALQTPQWFSRDWWISLWLLSSKIPPLVYLLTAPLLNLFGTGFSSSIWINLLFHGILLLSIYGIASFLFTSEVGLWSAALCSMLPGMYPLRLHFLLDYPVTAMTTLAFWALTLWWFGSQVRKSPDLQSPDLQSLDPQSPDRKSNRRRNTRNVPLVSPPEIPTQAIPTQADTGSQPEISKAEIPKIEIPKTEVQLLREAIATSDTETTHHAASIDSGNSLDVDSPGNPIDGENFNWTIHPAGVIFLRSLALGVALGLALLTKQTVVLFLLIPLIWVGVATLCHRRWWAFLNFLFSIAISIAIAYPWYRTNWLLILTSSERATVQSAIAEGDPALTSLGAWTYYFQQLPEYLSYPFLLVAIAGFLLYGRRVIQNSAIQTVTPQPTPQSIPQPTHSVLYQNTPESRDRILRQQQYQQWWRSVKWLLVFLISAYLLCSLNINKDSRYFIPAIPILVILLTQGLMVFPRSLWEFRWGTVGLLTILMLLNLFPILPGTPGMRAMTSQKSWHQGELVDEMIATAPYLRHTVGVLPSIAELNQHNVNYIGSLRNFQVYARQVGTRASKVWQDARSLNWYITKTGNQGSIRKPQALANLSRSIEDSADFQLHKVLSLPDGSDIKLYRRMEMPISVTPLDTTPDANPSPPVQLLQVKLPKIAPADRPVPVQYQWQGSLSDLRSGVVVLTWNRVETPNPTVDSSNATDDNTTDNNTTDNNTTEGNSTRDLQVPSTPPADRWFHDHGIGLGNLIVPQSSSSVNSNTNANANSLATGWFQVTERLAMLPPPNAKGTYRLSATYVHRQTGANYPIATPPASLKIRPNAKAIAAPEVDAVTKLRLLATQLPQGLPALDKIFDQVGQLNLYDPTQDYLIQAQTALTYRLQQEPRNRQLAYAHALTQVLQRRVEGAIAAFQQVIQLDPQNPNAHAYLAFVNLYDFRGKAAQSALDTALAQDTNRLHHRELQGLNAIAGLMQGHFEQAWQSGQAYWRSSDPPPTQPQVSPTPTQ